MAEKGNSEAAGLLRNLRFLAASSAGYLQARLKLIGLESKEAVVNWLIIVALVVAALALLIFGYLFLAIGLIVVISDWLQVAWKWVAVAFGIFHFIVALVVALIAKSRIHRKMFETSLAEFRKDQEWLTSTPKPL